jgi:hypothetical protein
MTDKTYFPAGAKITLADGTYKNIEDIEIGDEVQTYDMQHKDFDSANIGLNEQTSTKVKVYDSEEMNLKDFIKIEFKLYVNPAHDLSEMDIEEIEGKEVQSLTINQYGRVMGGSDLGWVAYKRDKLVSFLNANSATKTLNKETGELVTSFGHDFSDTITQLEVGQLITTDSGENLKEFEVTAITDFIDEDEEITAYCIESSESGSTIFVNDVLVRAEIK